MFRSYSTTLGASTSDSCLTCPSTAPYSVAGASALTGCKCGPGTWSATGDAPCTTCVANTYSSSNAGIAITSCLACGTGKTSPAGSMSADNCICPVGTAGAACTACSAGTWAYEGTTGACSNCYSGTYRLSTVTSAVSQCDCVACPSHLTYTVAGSGLLTDCKCAAGKY